jgi:uncharacterized damage-inducible protein DinB
LRRDGRSWLWRIKSEITPGEITMPIRDYLISEFDEEMANTRKVLERVPIDRLDFKPHAKSFDMRGLAIHVATVPEWMVDVINRDSFDYAPPGEPSYRPPDFQSREQLLEIFDAGVKKARSALENLKEAALDQPWTLLGGGQTVFTMPRMTVLRGLSMNHLIHHRAQLCVYLRLNDVAVPGLYGPSADEMESAAG